jgi:hypothetical protein
VEWTREATLTPRSFLIHCTSPSHSIIISDSSNRALWQLPAGHLVAKQKNSGEKQQTNFTYEISLSYPQCSLTFRKILRYGTDGFNSPPKEVVLWIFIGLKIRRFQQGMNPQTLGPMASTLPLDHLGRLRIRFV